MRVSNRFTRGTAAYKCKCCGRLTRDTGRGDNELIGYCAQCYDLGGEVNHISDCGTFYDSPQNVLSMIDFIESKGGDASNWAELKTRALSEISK